MDSLILGAMPDTFNHTDPMMREVPGKAEQYVSLHVIHDDKCRGQWMPIGIKTGHVCKWLCLHACKRPFLLFTERKGMVPSCIYFLEHRNST